MNLRISQLEARIAQLSAESGVPTVEEEQTAAQLVAEAKTLIGDRGTGA